MEVYEGHQASPFLNNDFWKKNKGWEKTKNEKKKVKNEWKMAFFEANFDIKVVKSWIIWVHGVQNLALRENKPPLRFRSHVKVCQNQPFSIIFQLSAIGPVVFVPVTSRALVILSSVTDVPAGSIWIVLVWSLQMSKNWPKISRGDVLIVVKKLLRYGFYTNFPHHHDGFRRFFLKPVEISRKICIKSDDFYR